MSSVLLSRWDRRIDPAREGRKHTLLRAFSRARRQVQNPHVLHVRPRSVPPLQRIIGLPENQTRKQRLPVPVARESSKAPGLRINDQIR